MSIDKLLSELDKQPRDLNKLSECCDATLEDYIGVSGAYLDLMVSVKKNPDQVTYICNIIKELMNNINGLIQLSSMLNSTSINDDQIDCFAGQILRGENDIDALIEEFENITESSND